MKHDIGHSVRIGLAFGYNVGKISIGCLVLPVCVSLLLPEQQLYFYDTLMAVVARNISPNQHLALLFGRSLLELSKTNRVIWKFNFCFVGLR